MSIFESGHLFAPCAMAGYVAQADLPPSDDESQEEFSGEADYLERLKRMKWIEPRYALILEPISSDFGLEFRRVLAAEFLLQCFWYLVFDPGCCETKMSTQSQKSSSHLKHFPNPHIFNHLHEFPFFQIHKST